MYIELDQIVANRIIQTADDETVLARALEYGIEREAATHAIAKGEFNQEIALETRFSCGSLYYRATSKISDGIYEMTCETAGIEPNSNLGKLIPVGYIKGLTSAKLTEVLIPGTEIETVASVKQQLLKRMQNPPTSGNKAHYFNWAMAVDGVGYAEVEPLFNGAGTVKVTIVNAEKQPAEAALVEAVAAYIESVRPIGAAVTVTSAARVDINVSATVTLAEGYMLNDVQTAFFESLDAYLKAIALMETYVGYAKIGAILLSVKGVLDYTDLTINGEVVNIGIPSGYVPVLSTAILEV
nr:baseplate J/gp47 family protein [Fusibacter paucivorans]